MEMVKELVRRDTGKELYLDEVTVYLKTGETLKLISSESKS